MKLTSIASVVAILATATIARARTYDPYDSLSINCKMLKAKPAILESGEAIRRAISKVIPRVLRNQQNEEGRVVVTVAVDADGSARCVAAR